jgi:peptidoglycan/LPS O-acetylase OafA/YrhL
MHPTGLAETPSATTELRHNSALDGIRGLAILFVLARHLIVINDVTATPIYLIVRALRDSMFCGVDIFFALSGFLITRILVQTLPDTHFFRNFYARRSLRIFPLYYGVLLLVFAFTPVYHIHWNGDQWRLLTYSNRLFEARSPQPWNFYYGGYVSLVNFWSLHIEEQFYLLWPLCVFFLRTPKKLLILALSTSAVSLGLRFYLQFHGFNQPFLYTALITRFDSLLIGAALALALRTRLHALALKLATPLFLTATLTFAVLFALAHRADPGSFGNLFPLWFTLLATASTALVAMCLKPNSRTARIFRSRFLRFFGRYSYGLYVFHSVLPMFYMKPMTDYTNVQIPNHAFGNVLNAVIELALALGVSMLSYRYFEMPFLKLKRFFHPVPAIPTPAPETVAS